MGRHGRAVVEEARERIDPVFDFAELQEFKELRLKNYSSGMTVRLAFAVMIQADTDILLIDEVGTPDSSRFWTAPRFERTDETELMAVSICDTSIEMPANESAETSVP